MRQRHSTGFTLIEILIAIAILSVGVIGIIALFPSTIESASRVVEDTYSSTIVQSVVDSLAASRRQGRIFDGPPCAGSPSRYMLFGHDGVLDTVVAPLPDATPSAPYYTANWTKDYIILLPRGPVGNTAASTEPTLLYPVCDAAHNPAGTASDHSAAAIAGGTPTDVSFTAGQPFFPKPAADGSLVVWVRRAFPLGVNDVASGSPGTVRQEFSTGGVNIDSYPQYSFALALRRAKTDTTGDGLISAADGYSDSLYEVRIMVFRNFDGSQATHTAILAGSAIPKSNIPVREFVSFMDMGPGTAAAGAPTAPTIGGNPLNGNPH